MGHSGVGGLSDGLSFLRNAAVTCMNLVRGPICGREQGKSGNMNDQNYNFIP
jgi:hypothetical protein